MRCVTGVVVLLMLFIWMAADPAWAIDPMLMQAQEKLVKLGYDPGLADGVYGPLTRQALEAFQRAQKLPVTGNLDAATLQALDHAMSATPEEPPPVLRQEDVPLRVVLHYLRVYAYQPAQVLPYVTEQFRQGMTPQEWIEQTTQALAEQGYAYLGWQVQRLEVEDTRATVEVHSRVRIREEEQRLQEVFTLQRTPEGRWLIDGWQVQALPTPTPSPQTDS